MRAPVLLDSWWKRTVLGEVALNSLTGTLTSPKLIAPDQIARAISVLYSAHGVSARYDRSLAGNSSPALPKVLAHNARSPRSRGPDVIVEEGRKPAASQHGARLPGKR